MLDKLAVEFTKSRANRNQDNALVEGKNGGVIRKHSWVRAHCWSACRSNAEVLHGALQPVLKLLSALRVCDSEFQCARQADQTVQASRLPEACEKLKSLREVEKYRKEGMSLEELDRIRIAKKMSDTECARKVDEAKAKLLRQCKMELPFPPGR